LISGNSWDLASLNPPKVPVEIVRKNHEFGKKEKISWSRLKYIVCDNRQHDRLVHPKEMFYRLKANFDFIKTCDETLVLRTMACKKITYVCHFGEFKIFQQEVHPQAPKVKPQGVFSCPL